MGKGHEPDDRDGWARLRFAVIGLLLAAPPPKGRLRSELEQLARKVWQHPGGGEVRFSVSTIERWYYQARSQDRDPVGALRRRRRSDAGRERALSAALLEALRTQYRDHPSWTMQLHYGNLEARVEDEPHLGPMPSYSTLRRAMRRRGMVRRRRRRGTDRKRAPVEAREVLSYEVSRSHALWHCDFHHSPVRVLTPGGEWRTPILFGVIDDHSRLGCHLQWYLEETSEAFTHGLCQAFMKRGLPRLLMSDNGSPMIAGEVDAGLFRLGIRHVRTFANSPHQNGKMEVLWASVEGRLMAMLEGLEEPLTLQKLNDTTIAWLEHDYHRRVHRELGVTPLERLKRSDNAARDCPDSAALRSAFRIAVKRTIRRSDGTLSLDGVRFQVPKSWRHLREARIRYARWDLTVAELVTGDDDCLCLLHPLDKRAHADAVRRPVAGPEDDAGPGPGKAETPPLLGKILRKQAETGLPPAWIPFRGDADDTDNTDSTDNTDDTDDTDNEEDHSS